MFSLTSPPKRLCKKRVGAKAVRRLAGKAASRRGANEKGRCVIISVINQKGGVGKTTLSISLAAALAARKLCVLLVDADPQASALDWVAARGQDAPFAAVGMCKPILHLELPKMARDFDAILIDGPPRVYDVAKSAVMASDAVLIPVLPSQFDVWAATPATASSNGTASRATPPCASRPAPPSTQHRAISGGWGCLTARSRGWC